MGWIMKKKTELVKIAINENNFKEALRIAKDFRLGITKQQREIMSRAYECMVHPNFYIQIGIDVNNEIEKGRNIVERLAELQKHNIYIDGMTIVNSKSMNFRTGEHEKIPAIKMIIK